VRPGSRKAAGENGFSSPEVRPRAKNRRRVLATVPVLERREAPAAARRTRKV